MLNIEHLYFSYSNKPNLLQDINFSVNTGDYISIIGANGSGKSTLVRLILGLLQPSSGTIENSFANMAYVPQRFNQLNTHFPITVKEILYCYKNVRRKYVNKKINDVLTLLHMENEENTLIGQLSGGQCQKVFIARALLSDPELLILDEPSNGIDRQSQAEIYNFLLHLNRQDKTTVICVEHNLQAALKNSTAFYHIEKGKGHICLPEQYVKEYIKSDLGENKGNVYL
ncbi:metal ABC transporter ATP-binding protein [Pectinatus haikarae]|uniref:Zinc transport system ATP-binding protein n=1 Tax=Pectinatus haikarae TaxID=349096 RepID=A0ABT9Y4L9_9FIRM|nr:metal ABC transporter ATP-binding protein [Pectinatus haikarae]MDQ0202780.1 zinc transport system ATP-binding protein [Pectinatus haikarae]